MLTRRQKDVLDFITLFIERMGYGPSLEEIGRGLGLSSLATVHKHLENLKYKGVIRRGWNRSRQIEIVALFFCPTCGQKTVTDLSLSSIQTEAKPVESAEKLDGPHQRANADTTLTAPDAREAS